MSESQVLAILCVIFTTATIAFVGWVLFCYFKAGFTLALAICYLPRLKWARQEELAAARVYDSLLVELQSLEKEVEAEKEKLKVGAKEWTEKKRELSREVGQLEQQLKRVFSTKLKDQINKIWDEIDEGTAKWRPAQVAMLNEALDKKVSDMKSNKVQPAADKVYELSTVRAWYGRRTWNRMVA